LAYVELPINCQTAVVTEAQSPEFKPLFYQKKKRGGVVIADILFLVLESIFYHFNAGKNV
jgi:hypothetical protein